MLTHVIPTTWYDVRPALPLLPFLAPGVKPRMRLLVAQAAPGRCHVMTCPPLFLPLICASECCGIFMVCSFICCAMRCADLSFIHARALIFATYTCLPPSPFVPTRPVVASPLPLPLPRLCLASLSLCLCLPQPSLNL